MKRKVHWLDEIAQELYDELRSDVELAKSEIKGLVPLGTVEATDEEQLGQFFSLTPEALNELSTTIGQESVERYVSEMTNLAYKKLGPFAQFALQQFEQQPAQPIPQEMYNENEGVNEGVNAEF